MQPDKLTLKSQEALQEAQRIAHGYSHQEVDGEHLMLADTPEEFARKTLAVINDDRLRARLGEAGRRLVIDRYDWRVVARSLDLAYHEAARIAAVAALAVLSSPLSSSALGL